MAKKILPDETLKTTEEMAPDKGVAVTGNVGSPDNATPEITENEKQEDFKLDPRVDRILMSHPQYEKMYIDSKGGAYTVGTPELIRKGAVLYTNPYFN